MSEEKTKSVKLDKAKQSEIKEKVYTTKQVETSIAILESLETDVVLEALLFLSKYADIHKNNVNYLIKNGLVLKLLNQFEKNICILRVALRLLSVLLDVEDTLHEIDQDKYDQNILEITRMYIEHKDAFVKEFCVKILSKIVMSCRINTLIFKANLLNPIFDNLKGFKNPNMTYYTLKLLFYLMDAPAAVSQLSECSNFDPNLVLSHLNDDDKHTQDIVLDILEKLTKYGLPFLQEKFKNINLVEKMISILINETKIFHHSKIISIIQNCLTCEETNCYFVESVEFIELCSWAKTCSAQYLLPMSELFLSLSAVPEIRQILFDLSVEETILYLFRSLNKKVLINACKAVSNMSTHKFCCKRMFTPVIANSLFEILDRANDDDDPHNQVAFETIFNFIRRHPRGLDIILECGYHVNIINYFRKKARDIFEDTLLRILEFFYKCLVHPVYQDKFATTDMFEDIVYYFKFGTLRESTFSCEILANIVSVEAFQKYFLNSNGPNMVLETLSQTKDLNLITHILYFIFCSMAYNEVAMAFLERHMIKVIKNLPENIRYQIPLAEKVLKLAYNYYLPVKFYELNKLEVTDKLPNRFYIINGTWNGPFPFLETLEAKKVTPLVTIYLVDFSLEVLKGFKDDDEKQRSSVQSIVSSKSLSLGGSEVSSKTSAESIPDTCAEVVNYGRISQDAFLPRYIYHVNKYENFLKGDLRDRVKFLSEYVDILLCGPKEGLNIIQKIHEFKIHLEYIKNLLGNNIIPIGFLRLGFHLERALLFKVLADHLSIPCSLVKGNLKIYWNEIAILEKDKLKFYVIDLMENIGNLMLVGSRDANKYCNIR